MMTSIYIDYSLSHVQAYYDLYDQMGSGSAVPDLKTVIPYVKRKVLQVTNFQSINLAINFVVIFYQ